MLVGSAASFIKEVRLEERAHHDARKHQAQHPLALGVAAHPEDQHHGEQAHAEGGEGYVHAREPDVDRQRRAEARAGRGAQHVRGGHRVLEHALIRRAGRREAGADEDAHYHPRQAHVPDRRLHGVRPEGLYAEAEYGEEFVCQYAAELPERHGVAPEQEGQQYARDQYHRHQQYRARPAQEPVSLLNAHKSLPSRKVRP